MYYRLYPENWKEISKAIREDRAGGKCEWCGVANRSEGARDLAGVFHTRQEIGWGTIEDWDRWFGKSEQPKYIRIVLTVAHLGTPHTDGRPGNRQDKGDCRMENLAALCQRCHLNLDRPDHLARAAATREWRKRERDAARGWMQLALFP